MEPERLNEVRKINQPWSTVDESDNGYEQLAHISDNRDSSRRIEALQRRINRSSRLIHKSFISPYQEVMQRAVTVRAVDYDPAVAALNVGVAPQHQADPNRDVNLDTAQFIQNIRPYLLPNNGAQQYPGGNAIIGVLGSRQEIYQRLTVGGIDGAGLVGGDIDALSQALTTYLRGATAITAMEEGRLRLAVTTALVAITPTRLTVAEGGDFDQMIQNSGAGSRAKGAPTQITTAQIPNNIRLAVNATLQALVARNNLLVTAGDIYNDVSLHDNLGAAGSRNMNDIRTTHTNGAGWLPANPAIPGNLMPQHLIPLLEQALDSKTRKRARDGNADNQGNFYTNRQKKRYAYELKQLIANLPSNRNRLIAVWAGYSHSIGGDFPYIEFSVNHPRMNRMVYDFVNGRIYLTFHYNWHKGYNPFFRVTDMNDGY